MAEVEDQLAYQVVENVEVLTGELTLSSVFAIKRSLQFSPNDRENCKAGTPGAVRMIRLRDIWPDGSIRDPDTDLEYWRSDVPDAHLLRPGDVLLSEIVTGGRPKAAVVQDKDLPAVAVGSVLILRPLRMLDSEHLRLVLAFLRSTAVGKHATGDFGRARLARKSLETMVLPKADDGLAAALVELETAGRQIGAWSLEAGRVAGSVFDDGPGTDGARKAIIAAGQLTRLRAEAAAQLDDFGYVVRTRFPYPIALRWREVEARVSTEDYRDAYEAVLVTAEILLCYCALVTAALAHGAKIKLTAVSTLGERLATKPGGPTLGDWNAILQEAGSAKKRRGLAPDHPLHELGGFLLDDQATAARKSLSERRNAEAHLRAVDPVDLPRAVSEALRELTVLLERARFLADWSLVDITSVVWDSLQGEATLTMRRLVGDHPVVPTSTMSYANSAVDTGSLYLIDRDHRLYLLRPFLVGAVCAKCRTWSTFHVDKVEGQLARKSLEHGHTAPDEETDALRQVGLVS
ncbi:hypothetical protein [Amycolatopsis sp. RTGN1]|uniref:hypothetical protein n=1 Tax=Amycolatopsis ponsaeliensis TaxID=2992142 RepID=UPI0025513506|nr:hypothetical protein [Amycolatopsis sp. RTGN1]